MNARYQQPAEMDSVEVAAADREVDERSAGQVHRNIGSVARINRGSAHVGVMG
jgi:hypothetical protein